MGNPISVIKGGDGEQGTWVVKDLAIAFMMWANPIFAIACLSKLEELFRTGSVQLQSYSVKELLQMQLATIERAEEAEAKVLALEAKNEKLQYRSDFVDVCFETDGLFSMEQSVKILKLPYGRNILFQKLRENGVLTLSNTPMQKYISNGYFKVVEELVENGRFKKLIPVTYATQKGIGFMHKMFNEI